MACLPISLEINLPPKEWFYIQTEGIRKVFPSTPEIRSQARRVSEFRKANKLPRPGIEEALEDIALFTCKRLGCNPRWCSDGSNGPRIASPVGAKGGCTTCRKNFPL